MILSLSRLPISRMFSFIAFALKDAILLQKIADKWRMGLGTAVQVPGIAKNIVAAIIAEGGLFERSRSPFNFI